MAPGRASRHWPPVRCTPCSSPNATATSGRPGSDRMSCAATGASPVRSRVGWWMWRYARRCSPMPRSGWSSRVPCPRTSPPCAASPPVRDGPATSLAMLAIMSNGRGYSSADLPLYFEWHGEPEAAQPPLLLIHGGGATIESNWGQLIPALEGSRRMLAVELQGHGRTGPGERTGSFEGSADGVAALLAELAAGPVDVLGFSNGGQVAM